MKRFFLMCGIALFSVPAFAHFGMIIPSFSTIQNQKEAQLTFDIAFAHPMERGGMEMQRPQKVFVFDGEKKEDLLDRLKEKTFLGKKAWQLSYRVNQPGVYQFAVEPEPYFEPAEDTYIIHYTKVIVPAFGEEEGWDKAIGLKTEIIPITRPFANYEGNIFQGQVLLEGKPVAYGEVEVEYYNQEGKVEAPNDYFVTQVVKTDANGIFTYAVPWAGWWGFSALNTASEKLNYQGEAKNVELGAVLWTQFSKPKMKK